MEALMEIKNIRTWIQITKDGDNRRGNGEGTPIGGEQSLTKPR